MRRRTVGLLVVAVLGVSLAACSKSSSSSSPTTTTGAGAVSTSTLAVAPAPKGTPGTVTCGSVVGANGLKWTLSQCTDPANTGGTGTAVSVFGKSGTGTTTITWNATGTTKIAFTYGIVTLSKCPGLQGEITETGVITAGTGRAISSLAVGQRTSVTLCEGTTGAHLLQATKFAL